MKRTLTLGLAATALTAAIGLPAWSAVHAPADDAGLRPVVALSDDAAQDRPLVLASNDDNDRGWWSKLRRWGDDDDDESGRYGDDDGHGHDDDGFSANDPARAGTAQPPQNGLFSDGAAPKVQAN